MLRNRYGWLITVLSMCLLLAACGGDTDTDTDKTQQATLRLPDFTRIVKAVRPAVVNISALPPKDDASADRGAGADTLEQWFERFFGSQVPHETPRFRPHPSLGSGFIISSDGYILTNRHVIQGAGRIVVKLADRRQLVAEVVGADKYTDVALLKVDAEGLPTVDIGDPDALEVGSWVLAIGAPFGFETSVTAGIVSAKGRTLATQEYVPFIQTDVAINPGNSGGPLFNMSGEVVAINAQIYTRTGGYQGVSFAIPIDIAMNVAHQIKTNGTVQRGWLGVQIQNVGRALAQSFGLQYPHGALVARVFGDSPAAAAGVRAGDIILQFNGEPVTTAGALPPLVGSVAPGQHTSLTLLRDGEKQTLEVQIEARPTHVLKAHDGQQQDAHADTRVDIRGMTLEALSSQQRQQLGLGNNGVRVTAVSGGAAAAAGLRADDVILAVGKHWVDTPTQLAQRLEHSSGPVALLVWRDGERLYLALDEVGAEHD